MEKNDVLSFLSRIVSMEIPDYEINLLLRLLFLVAPHVTTELAFFAGYYVTALANASKEGKFKGKDGHQVIMEGLCFGNDRVILHLVDKAGELLDNNKFAKELSTKETFSLVGTVRLARDLLKKN